MVVKRPKLNKKTHRIGLILNNAPSKYDIPQKHSCTVFSSSVQYPSDRKIVRFSKIVVRQVEVKSDFW